MPAAKSVSGRSKRSSGWRTAVAVLGLLVATGCRGPEKRVVGMSVEGSEIECQTLGRGSNVVLILATIHGNEAAGTPLVRLLADYLAEHPAVLRGRRVVLMPLANPDGYALNTRHNANGIDLNRNFPAPNFTSTDRHGARPLSEPESRALYAVLRDYRPDQIVSIHQPAACVDYDGPAEELARAMSAYTDLPVKRIGSLPGSLGSYAGITLGKPIVTLELPATASQMDDEELWDRYGDVLLAAIRYPDPIDP
jgi:protein MpaA